MSRKTIMKLAFYLFNFLVFMCSVYGVERENGALVYRSADQGSTSQHDTDRSHMSQASSSVETCISSSLSQVPSLDSALEEIERILRATDLRNEAETDKEFFQRRAKHVFKEMGLDFDTGYFDWAYAQFQYYKKDLREESSVIAGLSLYLADRRNRKKEVRDNELDSIFCAYDGSKSKAKLDNQLAASRGNCKFAFLPMTAPRKNEFNFYKRVRGRSKAHSLKGDQTPVWVNPIKVSDSGTNYFFKSGDHEKVLSKRDQVIGRKKIAAEVAASLLDQLFEFNLVPHTEMREYRYTQGKKSKSSTGSAQVEVSSSFKNGSRILSEEELKEVGLKKEGFEEGLKKKRFEEELKKEGYKDALSEFQLFTYLISDPDRHYRNVFIDTSNYQFKSIDHESAFHFIIPIKTKGKLFDGSLPPVYTQRARHKLHEIKFKQLKKKLENFLTPDQIEALWLRIQIVRADMILKK